jgi:hypothetical protein
MAAPAQTPALHPVPERGAIVREQIDAVSIAIRKEQWFFLGTLVVFLLLAIYSALSGHSGQHGHADLEYGPAATVPVSLIALLIPFGVWRASDRERRAYDWVMPVEQSTHTIIRMLAGWLWLMLGVVLYLVFLMGTEALIVLITGGSIALHVPAWQWLVPFTAASIAYLLTSIPIIGSEHPWRWIGGVIIGYVVALIILDIVHMQDLNRALQKVVSGFYGLNAAIFGDVSVRPHGFSDADPTRWLGATALWGVLAIVGVWLVARRHSTS